MPNRRTPLRRESFELAQRSDSAIKRISISSALKQQRLEKSHQHQQQSQDSYSSSLSTSLDSMQNANCATVTSFQQDNTTQLPQHPKRQLCELKPQDRHNLTTESNNEDVHTSCGDSESKQTKSSKNMCFHSKN